MEGDQFGDFQNLIDKKHFNNWQMDIRKYVTKAYEIFYKSKFGLGWYIARQLLIMQLGDNRDRSERARQLTEEAFQDAFLIVHNKVTGKLVAWQGKEKFEGYFTRIFTRIVKRKIFNDNRKNDRLSPLLDEPDDD